MKSLPVCMAFVDGHTNMDFFFLFICWDLLNVVKGSPGMPMWVFNISWFHNVKQCVVHVRVNLDELTYLYTSRSGCDCDERGSWRTQLDVYLTLTTQPWHANYKVQTCSYSRVMDAMKARGADMQSSGPYLKILYGKVVRFCAFLGYLSSIIGLGFPSVH
ncbi:hypothetical protein VNO77_20058 [Canavalia gladiata]|uniref:Uncharacterized protein n=1 Tax=Canavalia gladiata TaxID=3824 RepID=A0AAN9QKY8_CANGL